MASDTTDRSITSVGSYISFKNHRAYCGILNIANDTTNVYGSFHITLY